MYATTDGLMAFAEAADLSSLLERVDLDALVEDVEDRLLAYIIPNTPVRPDEIDAFCKAVYAQIAFETTDGNAQLGTMPSGVSAFQVNGFSATIDGASKDGVSTVGISKRARAILLRAGLLYRGVSVC